MKAPSFPIILGIAVILRLVWILLIPVMPISDSLAYDIMATNIAEHGIYGFTPDEPGAYWAVGTSAIYAGVYMLFGTSSAFGIAVVNMISAIAITWLLYRLGLRYFNETAGRYAALVFALWPLGIQYSSVVASEIHFLALTLAGLLAWDHAKDHRRSWLLVILAGFFFAAATYVRPIALLIPAVLAISSLLSSPRTALMPVIRAAIATVIIFTAVAPWSARNEAVFGEPVFMSTNFWANFWMGNHLGTNGQYTPLPEEVKGLGEIARNDALKELSLHYLRKDPGAFVTNTIRKVIVLHERETIGVAWNETSIIKRFGTASVTPLKLISTGYWYVFLLLGLAGIVVLARRTQVWLTLMSPPVILWAYFTAVHAVIVVGDRYHMPGVPMIMLLAAVSLAKVLRSEET